MFGDLKFNIANISNQTDHDVGPTKQDVTINQINRYVIKLEKKPQNEEDDD